MKRITAVISGASLIFAVQSLAAGQLSEVIPWSEVGATATVEYKGDGLQVRGAHLECALQRLTAEVTSKGLWLSSTATASTDRFSVRAGSYGRNTMTVLPMIGDVGGGDGRVQWARPGVVEEYSVSADGVRQDFIVDQRPNGNGSLRVVLDVVGAKAEPMSDGARLVLTGSERELVYNRLRVTDAVNQTLSAKIEVKGATCLEVVVDDAQAVYPIRIDPTFSDADWMSMGGVPGANSVVYAAIADGTGNLYIGGTFTAVGDVAANRVAKWDGSSWSALGSGVSGNSAVQALALDSAGNLYIGGQFAEVGGITASAIAKWDGNAWSALGSGMNNAVYSLAVDGADNLYAGGTFTTAGGVSASKIAKWNGSVWSPLGSGMGINDNVYALTTDSSDHLYAGGNFNAGGVISASNIARWDGGIWHALGSGMNGIVNSLVHDGSGNLYAGGSFSTAGGFGANRVAKWNGSTWSALGAGLNNGVDSTVRALALDSSGDLLVGGSFTTAGGGTANGIAVWNGSSWTSFGTGMNTYGTVWALAADGISFFAGGEFTSVDGVDAKYLVQWDGSSWSTFGAGMNNWVLALEMDLSGNLYAGGAFTSVGGISASRVVMWDGSSWSALGAGVNGNVYALASDDAGNLYASGIFTMAGGAPANRIAMWNGISWSTLGTGLNNLATALVVDGAGNLYAGGNFSAAGGAAASYIAKWNGATWTALGSGVNSTVYALAVDSTNHLYAGGFFTTAGGTSAKYIAQWDGSAWSPLGTGMQNAVYALAIDYADHLYAGGYFGTAGGVLASRVAKWDGGSWSPLGSGVGDQIKALAVDGIGNVYAGGYFTTAGGDSANYIAKWDGSAWSPLGSGMNNKVRALQLDGAGKLYSSGDFTIAGTNVSAYLASAELGTSTILSNLSVAQREGTKLVELYYDLLSSGTNTASVFMAIADGGVAVNAPSTTGDIGTNVVPGVMRYLVWDGGADWSGNVASLQFTLYDGVEPESGSGSSLLAKTGQTISYLPGDDGELQTGVAWPVPRFTVTVNATAIDNLTGLEWVLEPAQMAGNSNPMTWSNAVVFCDNDTYQGGGWRLPSYKEMLSLVDFNNEAPALPAGHPFLGIDSVNYWTGSTSSWNSPTNAFTLYVGAGSVGASDKNNGGKVWPVRGGSVSSPAPVPKTGQTTSYQPHDDGALQTGANWPSPRFTDLGTGVVRDNLTGLEWANQPHSLVGNTSPLTWSNAVAFCASLNHGSTQDWRLPNAKELESIITLNSIGAVNWLNSAATPFNGILQNNYWTGTTKAGSTNRAWIVNTYIFGVSHIDKISSIRVWPVRTGSGGGALPTGVSAWSDTDSRDYSLTVSSPYGTPVPGLGTTSTFAWRSAITASVEGVVSAGGTNYTCSGWNGSGAIPILGSGTNTGPIVLTTVSSSIDWRWIADADSDQIPDNWELRYFGGTTGAEGTVDYDDDGYNTWQEYILGSNPTNGGSSFLFSPSPTQPTNTAFSIDFTTVPGRLYTVECTAELGGGNWQVLTNFIGDGSAVQIIDPANIPACFYQIRIDWVGSGGAASNVVEYAVEIHKVASAGQSLIACALSGDGAVVAGNHGQQTMFRWSLAGGYEALDFSSIPGNTPIPYDVSYDGAAVVGRHNSQTIGFLWTTNGFTDALLAPPSGINGDGSVVVGDKGITGSGFTCYTYENGTTTLYNDMGNDIAFYYFHDVSASGRYVSCFARIPPDYSGRKIIRYDFATGTIITCGTSDYLWTAAEMSADASVIIGTISGSNDGYYWEPASDTVTPIVHSEPGGSMTPNDLTEDGSLVVGLAVAPSGSTAFVWDKANGMQTLSDYLYARGVDTNGWTFSAALGISDDGNSILATASQLPTYSNLPVLITGLNAPIAP